MSVFKETGFSGLDDYKKVSDYLVQVDENLRRTFHSLSPEDNFSPEALQKYMERDGKAAAFELSTDGMISAFLDLQEDAESQISVLAGEIKLKVSKGEVTNSFNMEKGDFIINGNRLRILCKNFSADPVTKQYAMTGKITANGGELAGWTIRKNEAGDRFIDGDSGSVLEVGSIASEETWGFNRVEVLGDTDFRRAKIMLDGSSIDTDKTTVFLDGFTGRHIDAGTNDVVCGATRAYEEVTIDGQLSCKSCYTLRDGKTWSDRRLKEEIQEITQNEAEGLLEGLKPYCYQFIGDGRKQSGFIAQDVRGLDKGYGLCRDRNGKLRLGYAGFLPFLIKVLNRQTDEIRRLSGV